MSGHVHGDFADPDVLPLWQAVAARLRSGTVPEEIRTVRAPLGPAGLAMVNGWISSARASEGRRRPPPLRADGNGQALVPLPEVARALSLTMIQLADLVDATIGAGDRGAGRRALATAREALWRDTERILADTPQLRARLRAAGVGEQNITTTGKLVRTLARVRSLLPLTRPLPLARVSLDGTGDPHYFDLDGLAGARLVQLAAELRGVDQYERNPARDRAMLASVGVLAERHMVTVVALNLTAVGDGPTDRALRLAATDHRPHHLSYCDLNDNPPRFDASQEWLIVENPSVLEEAVLRGVDMTVLCTSGAFNAAGHAMLALGREQGISMRYSGDRDPAGKAIARAAQAYGARPYLMGEGEEDLSDSVCYQEEAALLDHLLGPDAADPLGPPRAGTE